MHSIMPAGLFWAIPSCAVIGALNTLAIYFLVVPDSMQQQFCRALAKVPRVGVTAVRILTSGNRVVHPFRYVLQRVAG